MHKLIAISFLMGAFLAAGDAAGQQEVRQQGFPFFEPVQPPRAIQVVTCRGLSPRAPTYKVPALSLAIADAVEWVWVDARLADDGRHVVFHGDRVATTTDANGQVRDLTLAEVLALARGRSTLNRIATASTPRSSRAR